MGSSASGCILLAGIPPFALKSPILTRDKDTAWVFGETFATLRPFLFQLGLTEEERQQVEEDLSAWFGRFRSRPSTGGMTATAFQKTIATGACRLANDIRKDNGMPVIEHLEVLLRIFFRALGGRGRRPQA